MSADPQKITMDAWDARWDELHREGIEEPSYGGRLSRHICDGDFRLRNLVFDNSAASLRLWNFLLTEEERLAQARTSGKKIVGAMKDLGTVPVMAYSLPDLVAFYPDGAWWTPCIMELSAGLLGVADALGIDESFCPVRAMLGAFETRAHFPIPDLLTCSVGATCDDFSAIAQRLEGMGHPIFWWEAPLRRNPDPGENPVRLPGGFAAPATQLEFVEEELQRVRNALSELSGHSLDDDTLAAGIREANRVRAILNELRELAYTCEPCPMPALEMLIAEMVAIHFCSDREEAHEVLQGLVDEVKHRAREGKGVLPKGAARIFWVNPVADLRAMNLLEECGGRICGSEYLFSHALDQIPQDIPPMSALAQMALADPMTGEAGDRADRIVKDIERFNAEGLIISRIPGASHCATEGDIIRESVQSKMDLPVVEIEVPPLSDAVRAQIGNRLEALVETILTRRKK